MIVQTNGTLHLELLGFLSFLGFFLQNIHICPLTTKWFGSPTEIGRDKAV